MWASSFDCLLSDPGELLVNSLLPQTETTQRNRITKARLSLSLSSYSWAPAVPELFEVRVQRGEPRLLEGMPDLQEPKIDPWVFIAG